MEELLAQLKADLFEKLDSNKADIESKIDSIKNDVGSIKSDITINTKKIDALDSEVKTVAVDIETLKYKVEMLENKDSEKQKEKQPETYADKAKSPYNPKKVPNVKEVPNNAINKKQAALAEAKKVVGIYPVTDRDLDYIMNEKGSNKNETLKIAANDFIRDELKINITDFAESNIVKVARPKKEDCERLYLHMKDEESATFLIRRAAQISNEEIKVSQFIPPQLYKRFCDLSKNTYEARKSNTDLKTQIRLGDDDLILLVKMKGETEWEVEQNLEEMGKISPPDWHRVWPVPALPTLTSPPKGRLYKHKNVHNLSSDSEMGDSENKKQKTEAGKVTKIASIFNKKDKKTSLSK